MGDVPGFEASPHWDETRWLSIGPRDCPVIFQVPCFIALFENIYFLPVFPAYPFFFINGPVHNVPRATVGQVQCKVQISAKPGCAYGLQLMTAPPWFPVGVVVVMSLVFPTRLDPSAFCGVFVVAASGLPTRWGPNVLVVLGLWCSMCGAVHVSVLVVSTRPLRMLGRPQSG